MKNPITLLQGDYREHLDKIGIVDAIITDPPYSARTHNGHDAKDDIRESFGYQAWSDDDVRSFVLLMSQFCKGWFCVMTSHDLIPAYEKAFYAVDRYCFAPIPCVVPGRTVRLTGDGPSCWTDWLIVARPKKEPYSKWGTLPGAYISKKGGAYEVQGGKPLTLMQSIIRDYSRKGDLICDPCAGGGTTLIAAAIEGRRAIGCELDPDTFKKAKARINKGYTPTFEGF